MRQTWTRLRTGVRDRVLDSWWLIRGGSRVGYRRLLMGPVLVLGLIVVLAVDVALLFQATRSEPASTVPVPAPAPTITVPGEEPAAFIDDPVEGPEVRSATVTRDDGNREETDAGDRTRDEREKGAGASPASTPSPSSKASAGSASDPSSPTSGDTPAAESTPDSSGDPEPGTGPGGGGPGGGDGSDGGSDGGGGGGGGG